MKTLPKSLRPDYRYLRIKIDSDNKKDFSEAVKVVNKAVKNFGGEKALAETDLWLIKDKFDFKDQEVIVKVRKDSVNLFRSALTLSETLLYTKNISGSQKSV